MLSGEIALMNDHYYYYSPTCANCALIDMKFFYQQLLEVYHRRFLIKYNLKKFTQIATMSVIVWKTCSIVTISMNELLKV